MQNLRTQTQSKTSGLSLTLGATKKGERVLGKLGNVEGSLGLGLQVGGGWLGGFSTGASSSAGTNATMNFSFAKDLDPHVPENATDPAATQQDDSAYVYSETKYSSSAYQRTDWNNGKVTNSWVYLNAPTASTHASFLSFDMTNVSNPDLSFGWMDPTANDPSATA